MDVIPSCFGLHPLHPPRATQPTCSKIMTAPSPQEPGPTPSPRCLPADTGDRCLDAASLLDMDHFANTISTLKSQGARPDLIGSIITHYASKWLPELSATGAPSPQGSTAAWLKKRFIVETLASMLPEGSNAVPCDFLLRLLRAASMVAAAPACLDNLEERAAQQLEEATLEELMIPAFSHTCGTVLDVGLVLRLVRRFVAVGSGAAMAKVARLLDGYLAEAALDWGLTVSEMEELARALPGHVRATDDGLYRAVDTYIKVHSNTITKQEKKSLCKLFNARKISSEASFHASQNERLPVRSVIQVLFSEQANISRADNGSISFSGSWITNPALPARVPSKRENVALQYEVRHLRDDVSRLQIQCHALQAQVERLNSEKKRGGLFRWRRGFLFGSKEMVEKADSDVWSIGRQTPMDVWKKRDSKRNGSMS